MDGYIVLSQNQRDWMRKVMKNMVSLTAYYSFAKQPLKESDYENIVMAFSNYTKKSQNNDLMWWMHTRISLKILRRKKRHLCR